MIRILTINRSENLKLNNEKLMILCFISQENKKVSERKKNIEIIGRGVRNFFNQESTVFR